MKANENSESFRLMMNQFDYSSFDASICKLESIETTLKWTIPPIQKLRNTNIHYRCPKAIIFH